MSEFMRRVISGEDTHCTEFRAYLEEFHAELPRATSRVMETMRRADGRTSYDCLADRIATVLPRSILDVGCGDGVLLERVQSRLPECGLTGIDLVKSELQIARTLVPNARLFQGDAADLPFEDASFDVVASHMVFMLMPDILDALHEAYRVLRPGGKLIFLIADFSYVNSEMRRLLGGVMEAIKNKHPNFKPLNPADPQVFTREGLNELLATAGFQNPVEYEEFEVCTVSDAESAYEAISQRYYIGSLDSESLKAVQESIRAQITSPVALCEGVRLVLTER